MTFREFYTKKTPKFILLRALLALVVLFIVAPPVHWLFFRQGFTKETFMSFIGIPIGVVVMLALIHLGGWWNSRHSDPRPDETNTDG